MYSRVLCMEFYERVLNNHESYSLKSRAAWGKQRLSISRFSALKTAEVAIFRLTVRISVHVSTCNDPRDKTALKILRDNE